MKKRILSLALSLSLAVSLFVPAFAAEDATQPVTPTAPEWINEEDYLIFPGDEVYLPENWAEIEGMREAARNGGTGVFRADGKPIDNRWPVGYGSVGFCFEVGLAWLKCAENAGLETKEGQRCLSNASRAFQIGAGRYSDQGLEEQYGKALYYRTELMNCRAYALTDRQDNMIYWYSPMSRLLPALGMTLDEFFDAPYMEHITPERRRLLTEGLNQYLEERGLPLYPPFEDGVQIFLDGRYIRPDIPAVITQGRTMIPIRAVAEALGADVGWEEATRQVTLTRAGTTIVMTIDSTTAMVNNVPTEMDVAPYISGGRTLLPVRYVAEFFGQKVEWEESTQRVYITEDKSVVGSSNLEAWALPMGAMLTYINQTGTEIGAPARFGSYARAAEWVEDSRDKLAGWGINDREQLVNTVFSMTLSGHNASFREMAADVKQRSAEERAAISEASSAWPEYMWAYTEQLDEKWGDRGILAWDLFRMSNLVQWGYTAGYVTYEEALALLEPAAILLFANFSSWDEAYENYVDGYNWWARNDVLGKNTMETYRGGVYLSIKSNSDTGHIFDDSLFETGVIGLPEE